MQQHFFETIRRCLTATLLFCLLSLFAAPNAIGATPLVFENRPIMRDFIGLNVHTVQFKPALYAPVCRRVRDYHPMEWDVGNDTSRPTVFPMAANGVDWGTMYGSWVATGYDIDACIMFNNMPFRKWKDPAADARAYGQAFARSFGPTHGKGIISSAEIGNEPAKYTEAQYRTIFENMARGMRAGDPKLTIATCAVMTGKPDQWSKPMTAIAGLEDLYDVINVHSYPFKDKWPTWRRSYPEDLSIPFLKEITDVTHWRDDHARNKQVWLTEFGYDSITKPPSPDGEWKQWVGVTDEQQARYIVRAFLVLSATPIDRAYLFFFNDQDEAQLHGASGITRNFHPKPSFYAMSHLYRTLGDYRLSRIVVRDEAKLYCFEYQNPHKPAEKVDVAWSPTGSAQSARMMLPLGSAAATNIYRTEQMPLTNAAPKAVDWKPAKDGIEIEVSEAPVYIWVQG